MNITLSNRNNFFVLFERFRIQVRICYNYQYSMKTTIRYNFEVLGKSYTKEYSYPITPQNILDIVKDEKTKLEKELHHRPLKIFIRRQSTEKTVPQFIKLTNKQFLEEEFKANKHGLIVQFFFKNKKDSISSMTKRIGQTLQKKQQQLKAMVNQLKDQVSQLYALEIINKTSSRISYSQIENSIDIFLIVCDPLVDQNQSPVYYDEINVTDHIERIKRASMSHSNLTIKVSRVVGREKELVNILSSQQYDSRRLKIAQIFTHIVKRNEKLFMSLQGEMGQQKWVPVNEILKYYNVELIIIIGVGANLLKTIDYPKPMILITTISLQEIRILTINNQRTKFDQQNPQNDSYCQTFLQSFYQSIFKKNEISDSIDQAIGDSKKYQSNAVWCCCLHQHIQGCPWGKIVSKIGFLEAHRLFKHNYDVWKAPENYLQSHKIQSFIMDGKDVCCEKEGEKINICCHNKQNIIKTTMHQQIKQIIFWNEKNYDCELQSISSQHYQNKFQAQSYDRPSGRKRPLTLFKLVNRIIDKDKVMILRPAFIALGKRYLSFAKQYIQVRDKEVVFWDIQFYRDNDVKNYLKNIIISLKLRKKLGRSQKYKLYLCMTYNPDLGQSFYPKMLKQIPNDIDIIAKEHDIELLQIKLIFVTDNPDFDCSYPLIKIQDPQPSQRYQYILSKYPYDYIKKNFQSIKKQIIDGQTIEMKQVQTICQDMMEDFDGEKQQEYKFLGFLSLFSQDGFYLTKSGKVILENVFSKLIVNKAINNKLPVQNSQLSDSIYLQLQKAYQIHFKNCQPSWKAEFHGKRLQYYYLLTRIYCQLWPQMETHQFDQLTRSVLQKEGLFSINILDQIDKYQKPVKKCKKQIIELGPLDSILYSTNNFRHIYHFNQIQKIIQESVKKKKNFYVSSSKSVLKQVQPFSYTYLFWNILHKTWMIYISIGNQFTEKRNQFLAILLIFLIRVEVINPFAQIARLQLYFLIDKTPPKAQEFIRCTKNMKNILNLIRTFYVQQSAISNLEFTWGQTLKFKDLINSCLNIAEIIIQILDNKNENQQLQQQFDKNKMLKQFTILLWRKQILKLTERRVLYYFNFTKIFRQLQSKSKIQIFKQGKEQKQKQKQPKPFFQTLKQFHKQFQLTQMAYQFRVLRNQLPEAERQQSHRILIEHYLKIQTTQAEIDKTIISQIKGKISLEYLPLFNHLCQKIEQKTLFNKKDLIILARARTILSGGKPYIINRKRNLTMSYMSQMIKKMDLKISYFTLTSNTLSILQAGEHNNKCQMLFLILTVDSPDGQFINFGQEIGIDSQAVHVSKFAEQIKNCKINILILLGQNSIKVCEKIIQMNKVWQNRPNIIACQNNKYSIRDQPFNSYMNDIERGKKAWQYICHQVNQISLDMLVISLISRISSTLKTKSYTFTSEDLKEIASKSIQNIFQILSNQFECAKEVINEMAFDVWPNKKKIEKINLGTYQDLTAKFYSSENNLNDQPYYQNVGRCQQVNDIINAITKQGQRCIEIFGQYSTGKSTILQQICWISQTKSLFKFGVYKFNVANDKDEGITPFNKFVKNKQFKNDQSKKSEQTGILIALDNVNQKFLVNQKVTLSKLKGKSITVLYSTAKRQIGEALQQILGSKNGLFINLNEIIINDVYSLLMSHIKSVDLNEDQSTCSKIKYSKKNIKIFQEKLLQIMRIITKNTGRKERYIEQGLKLLRQQYPFQEQEQINLCLDFYRNNFEALIKVYQNVKEIKVRIV